MTNQQMLQLFQALCKNGSISLTSKNSSFSIENGQMVFEGDIHIKGSMDLLAFAKVAAETADQVSAANIAAEQAKEEQKEEEYW